MILHHPNSGVKVRTADSSFLASLERRNDKESGGRDEKESGPILPDRGTAEGGCPDIKIFTSKSPLLAKDARNGAP
jgi:hypothetical protein